MKKFVFLLAMLFAMQTGLMAQLTGEVDFLAHLNETYRILVISGDAQTITFATPADYNNGVVEGVGILPGTSAITIEATGNWNTTIECPNFTGGAGGLEVIPIENLGFTITEDGAHGLATDEVDYTAGNPDPQELTIAPAPLISHATNPNAGDVTDNGFTLHWQMGTAYLAGLGTPPIGTMFDQLANGDFTTGDYTTTAVLTLIPE